MEELESMYERVMGKKPSTLSRISQGLSKMAASKEKRLKSVRKHKASETRIAFLRRTTETEEREYYP